MISGGAEGQAQASETGEGEARDLEEGFSILSSVSDGNVISTSDGWLFQQALASLERGQGSQAMDVDVWQPPEQGPAMRRRTRRDRKKTQEQVNLERAYRRKRKALKARQ